MRVLFCGGGTGGHVTPALAMADILRQNEKNTEIAFIGRTGGDENRAITREGGRLYTLDVSGLRRTLSLRTVTSLLKAYMARRTAGKIIEEFSPDVIIGTGGYVSWPVLSAGISKGIPTVIHESNAAPGLVTRLLSKKCDVVLLGHKEAANRLKSKENVILCPNPLRKSFSAITKEKARDKLGIKKGEKLILSFGGSLGAEKMNTEILKMMQALCSENKSLWHFHATGLKNYDEVRKTAAKLSLPRKCIILPYIDDMPTYLSAADLAITRCGAMTLSELVATATPAILIPSPNVTDNHQYENAIVYEKAGGAVVINEEDLCEKILTSHTKKIISNERLRRTMAQKMKNFKKDDPDKIVIFAVKKAIKNKAEISAKQ